MKFTPGGTTHLVVAPDKNDPGQIPLTDKVWPFVPATYTVLLLLHGVTMVVMHAAQYAGGKGSGGDILKLLSRRCD